MTTEERLERLIERHEALTQSVEMIQVEITELREAAESLLHVAQIHETRLTRLEGMNGDELTQ